MDNIITKSILETTKVRLLEYSTALLVQRSFSDKAEHTTLNEMSEFVSTSSYITEKINTSATKISNTKIEDHKKAPDPHGDRAFTTDSILSHIKALDPHGSNMYSDNRLQDHIKAIDPHGDRLFTTDAITEHTNSVDPHKDRAYSNTLMQNHLKDSDPHKTKLYTLGVMDEHKNEADPHKHKEYTNAQINLHKVEKDPHGLVTRITKDIKDHNDDPSAHNLDQRLADISSLLQKNVDDSINQKIGVTITPLSFGLVDKKYLPVSVFIDTYSKFPTNNISEDTLYVDKDALVQYIYTKGSYQKLRGDGATKALTTNDIPPGTNVDRQYLTKDIKTNIDNKVEKVLHSQGISLINNNQSTVKNIYLKGLEGNGSIDITDRGGVVVIQDNNYKFQAKTLETKTLLTTSDNILKNLRSNEIVEIKGGISAYIPINAGGNNKLAAKWYWDIDLVTYGDMWSTSAITELKAPSLIVQSSNGLVFTGKVGKQEIVNIYSATHELLGLSTETLDDGTFTIVLNKPILDGSKVHLITTKDTMRSKPTLFYTINTTSIRPIDSLSIDTTYKLIRGTTTRAALIEVVNSDGAIIGTTTSLDSGYFQVELATAAPIKSKVTISAKVGESLKTSKDFVLETSVLISPYNININDFHTIVKGKSEPKCTITISNGSEDFVTSTNAQGDFTYYTYSRPLTGGNYTIKVEDGSLRSSTIDYKIDSVYPTIDLPLPIYDSKEENPKIVTELIELKAKPSTGSTESLKFIYNTITKEIEIEGSATFQPVQGTIVWDGLLHIIRYTNNE